MPPDIGANLAPILGIVVLFSPLVYYIHKKMELKKIELMARLKGEASESLVVRIDSMSAEIASLRDTSTQFDISLQHRLEEIQHRLSVVEERVRPGVRPAADNTGEGVVIASAGR